MLKFYCVLVIKPRLSSAPIVYRVLDKMIIFTINFAVPVDLKNVYFYYNYNKSVYTILIIHWLGNIVTFLQLATRDFGVNIHKKFRFLYNTGVKVVGATNDTNLTESSIIISDYKGFI